MFFIRTGGDKLRYNPERESQNDALTEVRWRHSSQEGQANDYQVTGTRRKLTE